MTRQGEKAIFRRRPVNAGIRDEKPPPGCEIYRVCQKSPCSRLYYTSLRRKGTPVARFRHGRLKPGGMKFCRWDFPYLRFPVSGILLVSDHLLMMPAKTRGKSLFHRWTCLGVEPGRDIAPLLPFFRLSAAPLLTDLPFRKKTEPSGGRKMFSWMGEAEKGD